MRERGTVSKSLVTYLKDAALENGDVHIALTGPGAPAVGYLMDIFVSDLNFQQMLGDAAKSYKGSDGRRRRLALYAAGKKASGLLKSVATKHKSQLVGTS